MRVARTDDLETCLAIRRKVFIEEQAVPEELELDEYDTGAIHLLAWDGERPVGTARLLLSPPVGKIGRVAVLAECRGTGAGRAIMLAALDELRRQPGIEIAALGAQTHALGFYEALGFVAHGPEYDDAGIPHRDMSRPL